MPRVKRRQAGREAERNAERAIQPLALSIHEFAAAHGFSIDTYFKLQRQGIGPAVMRIGGRTLISHEAAA